MEGLETSSIRFSDLPNDNPKLRLDSQFQSRTALEAIKKIHSVPHTTIGTIAPRPLKGRNVSYEEDGSFPVVRSGDISNFLQPENLLRSSTTKEAFFLEQNDVLISSIGQGSIGKIQLFRNEGKFAAVSEVTVVRLSQYEPAYVAAFLSSRYGQAQIERYITGATGQLHLYPTDVARIAIPNFGKGFQTRISKIYDQQWAWYTTFRQTQQRVERSLLLAVGLDNWTPPEPLFYTARASDTADARRLDARFFAPRIQALLDIVGRDGRKISDVASPRRRKFRPQDSHVFNYIEIGNIDFTGTASSRHLLSIEAPSRATWHVRTNDIITTTVRPIRRLSAQITPEQDGFVCSSGFVVIRPHDIPPEILLTYLRLPAVCELLDLYASASMYPAITETQIFDLPLPVIDSSLENQIVHGIKEARAAIKNSTRLLELVTHAVEIAIDEGESSALSFLNSSEGD